MRRWLAEFAGAAAAARPSPPALRAAAGALGALAGDASAAVAGDALLAAHAVVRSALAALAAASAPAAASAQQPGQQQQQQQQQQREEAEAAWAAALDLLARVGRLADGSSAGPAGAAAATQMAAMRVCEQAALMLSADSAPALPAGPTAAADSGSGAAAAGAPPVQLSRLPGAPALAAAAGDALRRILDAVTAPGAHERLPGPVFVAGVKALASAALQRRTLAAAALPPLVDVALKAGLRAPAPGDGQSGGAASRAAALRDSLYRLLRAPVEWLDAPRAKLSEALSALGAPGYVDAAQRQLARALKRRAADAAGGPAGGAGGAGAAKRARGATPPDATVPEEQLVKLQEVVSGLVAHGQAGAAAAVLDRCAPAAAAGLVARLMAYLPPDPAAVGAVDGSGFSLSEGGALELVRSQAGGPLMLHAVPAWQLQAARDEAAAAALMARPDAQRQLAAAAAAVTPAPAGPKRPSPLPIPLTPEAAAALRLAAVKRIVACPYAGVARARQLLLARLAAKAPPDDGAGELLLQRVLDDWAAGPGQELAMRWLFALFVAHCGAMEARSDGEGSGGDEGMEEEEQPACKEEEDEQQRPDGDEEDGPQQQQQRRPQRRRGGGEAAAATAADSGGGGGQGDLSGTPYEDALSALLEGLRERLAPGDRSVAALLLDAPALPLGAVGGFLEDLLASGGEWATAALVAARVLIEGRPPARGAMLELALAAAAGEDAAVRNLAVQLAVNRLLARPDCEARILEFAAAQLAELEHLEEDEAPAAAAAGGSGSGGDGAAAAAADGQDGEEQQQQAGQEQEDQDQQQQEARQENEDGRQQQEQERQGEDADKQQQPNGAEQQPNGGGGEAADGEEEQEQEDAEAARRRRLEEEAARRCTLYMALCAKRPALLPPLLEAYGRWPPPARAAAAAFAKPLMRALAAGALPEELRAATEAPPPGGAPLLLELLHAYADNRPPPPRLVAAAVAHWKASGDASLVAPLVAGMHRADARKLLPRLLELEPFELKRLYQRLTGYASPAATAAAAAAGAGAAAAAPPPQPPTHYAPAELLVALHALTPAKDGISNRALIAAIETALHCPEVFKQDVVAAVSKRIGKGAGRVGGAKGGDFAATSSSGLHFVLRTKFCFDAAF